MHIMVAIQILHKASEEHFIMNRKMKMATFTLSFLVLLLVIPSCGKSSESVEGQLNAEMLQRRLAGRQPVSYRSDDNWIWTCERVYSVEQDSPNNATAHVFENGRKLLRSITGRRRGWKTDSRDAVYHLVRDSVDEEWYIDNSEGYPVRRLGFLRISTGLKTGEYVKPEEPKSLFLALKPNTRPETPIPPAPEIQELPPSPEPEDSETEASIFPDKIVLTTGKEMECEVISETSESVRIRSDIGEALVPRARIRDIVRAGPEERKKYVRSRAVLFDRKEAFERRIKEPVGMAFTTDGDLVVIAGNEAGSVYMIDIEDGQNNGLVRLAPERDFPRLRCIAVGPNNMIYVTSPWQSGALFQMSSDGATVKEIWNNRRLAGNDFGALMMSGLGFDIDDDLFIMYRWKHLNIPGSDPKTALWKFQFNERSKIAGNPEKIAEFDPWPCDFVCDTAGNLYCSADEIVMKMTVDADGNPSGAEVFTTLPTEEPEATTATCIGIDGINNLYVGQRHHVNADGRIFKIDTAGNMTSFLTGLDYPFDIVSDSEGYIYISDRDRNSIFRVSAD